MADYVSKLSESKFSRPQSLPMRLAACAMLAALAPALVGQGAHELPAAPSTSAQPQLPRMVVDENANTISFSMAESMGLTDFVKWAQQVTGKRFTYNLVELGAGSVGNTVHFLGEFRINRDRFQDAFFSFFQTMLYIKGFAIVPRGEGDLELFEIVMMLSLIHI